MKTLLRWILGSAVTLLLCVDTIGCGSPMGSVDEWCKTHRCEVAVTTFAPTRRLEPQTIVALERIALATGRDDLRIEDDGLPIEHESPIMVKSERVCGLTNVAALRVKEKTGAWRPQRIAVEPEKLDGCPGWDVTVLHEMIHALAPNAAHAETGVFSEHATGGVLDESSLAVLCSGLDCRWFDPE